MKLTTHIYLVLTLGIGGAVDVLLPSAFVAWTGKPLPFSPTHIVWRECSLQTFPLVPTVVLVASPKSLSCIEDYQRANIRVNGKDRRLVSRPRCEPDTSRILVRIVCVFCDNIYELFYE